MQALIKRIRSCLCMSQTEFAEHMNVSYLTVNRWENGHSIPNKLAQSRIYEICKADNVPVYEFTLERIRGTSNEPIILRNRTSRMKQLIEKIESNDQIKGEYYWEKVLEFTTQMGHGTCRIHHY